MFEKCCGWQEIDFDLRQFICERRENGFSVALFKFSQQHHRLQIRPQIVKVFRRDLSGHDRVMNILLTKKFQEPPELSNTHPLDHIDMLPEHRIGLAGECGSDDLFNAGFPRCIGHQ